MIIWYSHTLDNTSWIWQLYCYPDLVSDPFFVESLNLMCVDFYLNFKMSLELRCPEQYHKYWLCKGSVEHFFDYRISEDCRPARSSSQIQRSSTVSMNSRLILWSSKVVDRKIVGLLSDSMGSPVNVKQITIEWSAFVTELRILLFRHVFRRS